LSRFYKNNDLLINNIYKINTINYFLYLNYCMYRYLIGFSLGIWVGTYYNCKPIINKVKDEVIKNLPKEKD
jgi:hypothetical protein